MFRYYNNGDKLKNIVKKALQDIIAREDKFISVGSGWVFVCNLILFVNIFKLRSEIRSDG